MALIFDYDPKKAEILKRAKKRAPRTRDEPMTALSQRVGHLARSGGGLSRRDFERLLGRNDMLPINYLERGMMAARAVARIDVREPFGGAGNWGTGFLVTPRLLLTNNHVVASPNQAQRTTVEFCYERSAAGEFRASRRFRLEPDSLFLTSPADELDVTLVAMAEQSSDATAAATEFGYLRLDPGQHKIEEGDFVTIIQHPSGDEKFIAVRENKVIQIGQADTELPDSFLWYASDTAPGSSGAPAFNDGWQVVAVHHKGVPVVEDRNGRRMFKRVDGGWVSEEDAARLPDDMLAWVANEGVRTSKIVAFLRERQADLQADLLQDLLDDIEGVRPLSGVHGSQSVVGPETIAASGIAAEERAPRRRIRPADYYRNRAGYDPDFLGVEIPLPAVTDDALRFGAVAEVRGTDDDVLRYEHFSVVFNADRQLAFLTAVNIDGRQSVFVERKNDQWFYDPRLPLEIQAGDELYGNEPNRNYFDRGHLVRRQDPLWGDPDVARRANIDTFHWTNCSPQYWAFNQKEEWWQGLENFILHNTDQDDLKASVFTGPVFQDEDEVHRGVPIPQAFWKVVAVTDRTHTLFSSAYVVSQKRYATNIPFERLPVGEHNGFQVAVIKLEEQIGLDFGPKIRNADVHGGEDDLPLRGLADIHHPRRG